MDSLRKFIGKRLKAFRKGKRLTQDELAERVETDSMTISRYERGVSIPGVEQLMKIAEVLGVSPQELLPVNHDATREQVLALRRRMTELVQQLESPETLAQLVQLAEAALSSGGARKK